MDSEKYDALVLSGGGTKGLVELGVLHYYHEKGVYDPLHVKEYAGASIGSVICLLLVCGYSPMEIFQKVYSFENMFTLGAGDANSIWTVVKEMGMMSVNLFSENIENLVRERFGCVPSLQELKESTEKTIYISVANVTKLKEEKISYLTHPDLSCIDAIKMSCNLPVIFQRIKYKNNFMVDGGLLNNFPWDYISNECHNILGIVITGSDLSLPDDTFMGFFYRLMVMPINQLTELRCQTAPEHIYIVKLECSGVPVFQFVMENNKKMDLFLSGYNGALRKENTQYLCVKGWDWKISPSEEEFADVGDSETQSLENIDDGWDWGDPFED